MPLQANMGFSVERGAIRGLHFQVNPAAGPSCDVVTIAKCALKAGKRLDGIGGFCSYGLIDNHSAARAADALPIALSEGCVLVQDVAKDAVVVLADVRLSAMRLSDRLWQEKARR